MAPSRCGCLWPPGPFSRHHPCVLVLSFTMHKHTRIPLHTEPIHSPETRVAICQGPGNKVPFTFLFSFFSIELFEGKNYFLTLMQLGNWGTGQLGNWDSKTKKKLSNFPWSSQLVSHRVKTYTRLQNQCALLPALWWIFCHLKHVEEKDILSSRRDLLRSPCSLVTSLPSLVRHMGWILPFTRHEDTWG